MKTIVLLCSLLLIGAGCSTAPTTLSTTEKLPAVIQYQHMNYFLLPVPIEYLHAGDLVIYREGTEMAAAEIKSKRGERVYRVAGDGLSLVTPDNYVAKLVRP